MIKHLRKNITILFVFLFTLIWVEVLVLFVNVSYQHARQSYREDFVSVLRENKLARLLDTKGENADFNGVSYAAFLMQNGKPYELLFHTYTDKTTDELFQAAYPSEHQLFHMPKEYMKIFRTIKKRNQEILFLVDQRAVLQETLPVAVLCLMLAAGGVMLFIYAGRLLSGWLIRPITDMINSEKTFISNASHELKTPLSVIRANAQLLGDEVSTDNKHLQYIETETERMITLVNQMLTLARLEAPQVQEQRSVFSVSGVLCDVIYPMESVAYEKQIALETDIPTDIKINGNENQIQTLISILLNNALCYTPAHGTISIHAASRAHRFYLSVANTGDPIPDEIRSRLFERFFRADEARGDDGHFGLGLSIAQSIVLNHSGKIDVHRIGDKNVFAVMLPE